jgi:hypothetical protein
MRKMLVLAVLMSASFLLAQTTDSGQSGSLNPNSSDSSGQITVRGCVGRMGGDYILTKQDPGNTYQLQAGKDIKLGPYLGQRVEVTGTQSPTMATSSDETNRGGSASPVTITVSSIKTLSKECRTP